MIPVLACSAGLIWSLLSLLAPLVAVMPDLSLPFGVPICVDPVAVLPAPELPGAAGVLAVLPFGVGG
ncbi:hypothetical protein ABIB80_004891 [Bradyrhizobium sp. i1.15.2]